jgi:hypothetical protein
MYIPQIAFDSDLWAAPESMSKTGAGYGTRTRNLLITNQLLYQLS